MTKVHFVVRNVDEVVKKFIRDYARMRNIAMGQALDEIVQRAKLQLNRA